jgi:hypothetical protein
LPNVIANFPAVGFVFGCMCAALLVLRYNLRTAVLVREVQAAANSEGRDWEFWGDPRRVRAFVWDPSKLLDVSDSPAIHTSKLRLLRHRRTVRYWLLAACMLAVAGPLIGLFAMVLLAH